jgi:hypothetical protein
MATPASIVTQAYQGFEVTERVPLVEVALSRILALSSARSLEIWPRPSESGS